MGRLSKLLNARPAWVSLPRLGRRAGHEAELELADPMEARFAEPLPLEEAALAAFEPVPEPEQPEAAPARPLLDPVYLSRLALGMIFVGALAYEPSLALAFVGVLVPLVTVLALVVLLRRKQSAERDHALADPQTT